MRASCVVTKSKKPNTGRTRSRTLEHVVREVCLGLPETEEKLSHGTPDFHVRGKTFATYAVNHHGDGRVALWLNAPDGAQRLYSERDPGYYFVPPYVGPRGWLGVELNQGLAWERIAQHVVAAYNKVAPKSLSQDTNVLGKVKPPSRLPTAAEIDPMQGRREKSVLAKFEKLLKDYPETSPDTQFGTPIWRAGKKTFANFYHHSPKQLASKQASSKQAPAKKKSRLYFSAWVGVEQQAMLTFDKRYHIPAYTGHNGWIALDIEEELNWSEIESLTDQSYRHFALKRMLKALDGS